MDIEGRQVGQRPAPNRIVVNLHRRSRLWDTRRMAAHPSLDARLLIRRNDEVIVPQRLAHRAPGVKIEDAAGLGGEVGIAGEDSSPALPGADRIRMEPVPDGRVADGLHQSNGRGLRP